MNYESDYYNQAIALKPPSRIEVFRHILAGFVSLNSINFSNNSM